MSFDLGKQLVGFLLPKVLEFGFVRDYFVFDLLLIHLFVAHDFESSQFFRVQQLFYLVKVLALQTLISQVKSHQL